MRQFIGFIALSISVALLIAACNSNDAALEIDETLMSRANKQAICHYQEDEGVFKLLWVGGKAKDAHLNHGDVEPLGDVPSGLGYDGYTLGENCEYVAPPPPPVTCPCWNDPELNDPGLQFIADNLDGGPFNDYEIGGGTYSLINPDGADARFLTSISQCQISLTVNNPTPTIFSRFITVTEAQADACLADIMTVADNLGCPAQGGSCPAD